MKHQQFTQGDKGEARRTALTLDSSPSELIQSKDSHDMKGFERPMCHERNEAPIEARAALNHALEGLELKIAKEEAIQDCIGQELEMGTAVADSEDRCDSSQLEEYKLPELKCLGEIRDYAHHSQIHAELRNPMAIASKDFIEKIKAFRDTCGNVFPVPADYFSNTLSSLLERHPSPGESNQASLEVCKKELMRIAFMSVLLHLELSDLKPEEKTELYKYWNCQHKQPFNMYLEQQFFASEGRTVLLAVFTHDDEALIVMPEIEYVEGQEEELSNNLDKFFRNPKEKMFILDCDRKAGLRLNYFKRSFQQAADTYPNCNKLLCLLIRTNLKNEINTDVSWEKSWKIATFETLQCPGFDDMATLAAWLTRSNNDYLFPDPSSPLSEAIFERAYNQLQTLTDSNNDRINQIIRSPILIAAFKRKLISRVKNTECTDWKTEVLSLDETPDAPDLLKAINIVRDSQIAKLLAPEIFAIEKYNEFPSFFEKSNSITQTLWLQFFQMMQVDDLDDSIIPNTSARMVPFSAYDYTKIIRRYLDEPSVIKELAPKFQILEQDQTLVDGYCTDIFRVDIEQRNLLPGAEDLYTFLSASKVNIEEKLRIFRKYHERVVSLYKPQAMDEPQDVDDHRDTLREHIKKTLDKFQANKRTRLRANVEVMRVLENFEVPHHLYVIQSGKIHAFDCLRQIFQITELNTKLVANECSVILLEKNLDAEEGKLLGSGGVKRSWYPFSGSCSSDAFYLSIRGGVYTPISEMKSPRIGHGIVQYKETVYVFGGTNGTVYIGMKILRTGEKFSLVGQPEWKMLNKRMSESRTGFSPCVLGDEIYLCGGCAFSIDVFKPLEESFRKLDVQLPDNSTGIAFVPRSSNHVIVSTGTAWSILDRNTEQFRELKRQNNKYKSCLGGSPVVLHGEVFMINAELRMVGWVNAKTGETIGEKKIP